MAGILYLTKLPKLDVVRPTENEKKRLEKEAQSRKEFEALKDKMQKEQSNNLKKSQ